MKKFNFFALLCGIILFTSCDNKFTEPSEPENPDTTQMKYELSDGEVTITSFPDIENVVIPSEIEIEGTAYPVTILNNNSLAVANIKTIHIPPTIKKIGKSSFRNTDIEAVYIEDIASWCNIYFEFDISSGNTFIDYSTNAVPFSKSTKLYINENPVTTLEIKGTEQINIFAFSNLNCEKVKIGEGVKKIDSYAFANSSLEDIDLGNDVDTIGMKAFRGCSSLNKIILSTSLRLIEYSAFEGCNVKEVYSPSLSSWLKIDNIWAQLDGVNFEPKFGSRSFDLYFDGNLAENIVTPEDTKKLEAMAFAGSNIKSAVINEGVTEIGINAFNYCGLLESLELPSTLEIFQGYLDNCPELRSITLKSVVPPSVVYPLEYIISDSNSTVPNSCTLYVPEESVETYRKDKFWGVFKNIFPIN